MYMPSDLSMMLSSFKNVVKYRCGAIGRQP